MTLSPRFKVPEHLLLSDMQLKRLKNQMSANLVLLKASFWRILCALVAEVTAQRLSWCCCQVWCGNNTCWHAVWKLWSTCHSANLQWRTFGWSHSSYGMWMLDANTPMKRNKIANQVKCRDCAERKYTSIGRLHDNETNKTHCY